MLLAETMNHTTVHVKTGCSTIHVTAHLAPDRKIHSVIVRHGRTGSCQSLMAEMMTRTINQLLESGTSMEWILKTFSNQRCSQTGFYEGRPVFSCYDGVAQALQTIIDMG